MTIKHLCETLSLFFLSVSKSIWVRIWKIHPVLPHKESLTESSFTSSSFSLASGLKSGMIALPCWHYLIGKPPGMHTCWWKTQVGHGSVRLLADNKQFGLRLKFSGAFPRCPLCVLQTQSRSSEILTNEGIIIERLKWELGEFGSMVCF